MNIKDAVIASCDMSEKAILQMILLLLVAIYTKQGGDIETEIPIGVEEVGK